MGNMEKQDKRRGKILLGGVMGNSFFARYALCTSDSIWLPNVRAASNSSHSPSTGSLDDFSGVRSPE